MSTASSVGKTSLAFTGVIALAYAYPSLPFAFLVAFSLGLTTFFKVVLFQFLPALTCAYVTYKYARPLVGRPARSTWGNLSFVLGGNATLSFLYQFEVLLRHPPEVPPAWHELLPLAAALANLLLLAINLVRLGGTDVTGRCFVIGSWIPVALVLGRPEPASSGNDAAFWLIALACLLYVVLIAWELAGASIKQRSFRRDLAIALIGVAASALVIVRMPEWRRPFYNGMAGITLGSSIESVLGEQGSASERWVCNEIIDMTCLLFVGTEGAGHGRLMVCHNMGVVVSVSYHFPESGVDESRPRLIGLSHDTSPENFERRFGSHSVRSLSRESDMQGGRVENIFALFKGTKLIAYGVTSLSGVYQDKVFEYQTACKLATDPESDQATD